MRVLHFIQATAFWRSDIVNHFTIVGIVVVIAFLKLPSITHFEPASIAICANFQPFVVGLLCIPIISLSGEAYAGLFISDANL